MLSMWYATDIIGESYLIARLQARKFIVQSKSVFHSQFDTIIAKSVHVRNAHLPDPWEP